LTQVSHELRTPLTVLSGYVQMLCQQLHEDETVPASYRELADLSVDGVKRLHRLMNEIVIMARVAANQINASMAPAEIGEVVGEAIEEYRPAFERRNISLERVGNCWEQVILLDANLFRLAVSNLISNAIKFTPDGGSVAILIEREADVLHIAIQDTGVGIMLDHLPLLFKPFYTSIDVSRGRTSKTDFMGMGMGIGLTIVTKIVEAHNGRLWAESPGYDEENFPGSTFHVLLPGASSVPTGANDRSTQ
jgi:signal transduction histidine kinase